MEYEFKYIRKENDSGQSLASAPVFGTREDAQRVSREYGVVVVLLDINTRKQVDDAIDNRVSSAL